MDLLGENGRRNITRGVFSLGKHAFLADVLRAVHDKALVRLHTVLNKEFALEFRLGEVFDEDSILSFKRQAFNKC